MARKLSFILLGFAAGIAICYGCHEKKNPYIKKPEHTFSANGSVREIVIVPETPEFPEHEGKAEFMSYCAMCHSLRYIAIQPAFPVKTWEAEVDKMITKFKAPIDSVTAKKIVSYLVAIKSN